MRMSEKYRNNENINSDQPLTSRHTDEGETYENRKWERSFARN